MLTSFWAVSLYAVLSGLSGLSVGRWLLPSDRALDRAWDDGWGRGRADVWQREDDAYWRGRDDQRRRYNLGVDDDDGVPYCSRCISWHRWEHDEQERDDGQPPEKAPQDPQPRAEEDDERRETPPVAEAARAVVPTRSSELDWADELVGIRTQIAVDDATEVLAAQPDPPTPGSFEYYLSDWQSRFDHWLAGEMAELAATRRKLGIS